MKRIISFLVPLMIIIVLAASCSGYSSQISNNLDDEIIAIPENIKKYIKNIGNGLECLYSDEINIGSMSDSVSIHNNIVAAYANNQALSEWKIGGLSFLISKIIDNEDVKLTSNFDVRETDVSVFYPQKGVYLIYNFASNESGLNYSEYKECWILIEKGTEDKETPHMYIWVSQKITGNCRSTIQISLDGKVFTEYFEIGRSEE